MSQFHNNFCSHCGFNFNGKSVNFCSHCGEKQQNLSNNNQPPKPKQSNPNNNQKPLNQNHNQNQSTQYNNQSNQNQSPKKQLDPNTCTRCKKQPKCGEFSWCQPCYEKKVMPKEGEPNCNLCDRRAYYNKNTNEYSPLCTKHYNNQ
jgi:hypothetical protein